jgi:hypothetical protein
MSEIIISDFHAVQRKYVRTGRVLRPDDSAGNKYPSVLLAMAGEFDEEGLAQVCQGSPEPPIDTHPHLQACKHPFQPLQAGKQPLC